MPVISVRNTDGSSCDVLPSGGEDGLSGLFSSILGGVANVVSGGILGGGGGGGQAQAAPTPGFSNDPNQLLNLTFSGIQNILKAVLPATVPIIAATGGPSQAGRPAAKAAARAGGGGGGAGLVLIGGLLVVALIAGGRRK